MTVDVLHRAVSARYTEKALGPVSGDGPIHPGSVETYLASKFGNALDEVYEAMKELARSLSPSEFAERAYALYEKFRAEITPRMRGQGTSGKLNLNLIRKIACSKE